MIMNPISRQFNSLSILKSLLFYWQIILLILSIFKKEFVC